MALPVNRSPSERWPISWMAVRRVQTAPGTSMTLGHGAINVNIDDVELGEEVRRRARRREEGRGCPEPLCLGVGERTPKDGCIWSFLLGCRLCRNWQNSLGMGSLKRRGRKSCTRDHPLAFSVSEEVIALGPGRPAVRQAYGPSAGTPAPASMFNYAVTGHSISVLICRLAQTSRLS